MNTNFTLRDFFVYMLSGLILTICAGVIFINDVFNWAIDFFKSYTFIKDFSFLITILLIPIIYLFGHIIGTISYYLLKIYTWLDKGYFRRSNEKPISNNKYYFLMFLQILFYRHSIVYEVAQFTKLNTIKLPFKDVKEFWKVCARLQIDKTYTPAEYWYVLNELFNSLRIVFFIALVFSVIYCHLILAGIYSILTIFSYFRAKQYSTHFVQTVYNLSIAKQ